ncbi:MAG: chorismate synthase [Bdellovibrionales bacterium]|nr:chorismate synthase [Bdellovibrionales bacterium]
MGTVGNTFGTLFRITTFGESHGPALGVVIDGCPAGIELDLALVRRDLDRRRPGQSKLVTQRKETEEFEILSGLFEGKTTGTPLTFIIRNQDTRSKDYEAIKDLFRPGHADFTYFAKYGHRDYRGGGRSSARETAARVIGGAVAKQLLAGVGVSFVSGVVQVGTVRAEKRQWEMVEQNDLRSPDPDVAEQMRDALEAARKERDSLGGIVEVVASGVPVGLGEPVFAKLDAAIGAAMFSIPAVKGVEIGAGFSSAELRGSAMNDEFFPDGFRTNHHGGVLGGLSSGAPIVVRLAIKPTSSIPQEKQTIDTSFAQQTIKTLGRHDPCVALRAPPIAEAMLALVLVDFWMQQLALEAAREPLAPHVRLRYGMSKTGEEKE